MKDKYKRMKASEVYRESPFVTVVPFAEVFPQIEDFSLEVIEDNAVKVGERVTRSYNRVSLRDLVVNCSNPLCYSGGFSVGDILREMMRTGQTEYETTVRCNGYEGSPKGVRRYGDCYHFFEVKLRVKYKEVNDS